MHGYKIVYFKDHKGVDLRNAIIGFRITLVVCRNQLMYSPYYLKSSIRYTDGYLALAVEANYDVYNISDMALTI